MLKINTRISLSHLSKGKIRKLVKKNGNVLDEDSWTKINKSIKNELSKKLFANQGFKCVYCERYLVGLSPQIDHFAHKALYPQFTFTTINLFYSCDFCNSSSRKGQKPTIQNLHTYYNSCDFKIVHPYFDDPDTEIKFQDADKIFFDWSNCTQKGKDTIEFFEFNDSIMTSIRSRTLTYERLQPILTVEERQLIQDSISYK